MARLQDFQTVTPTDSDNLLVVQATGQGLATVGSTLGSKMDKANPTGTGSLSLNRKADTTVGTNSVTFGNNCEASGNYSLAEGDSNKASGAGSHAEGYQTLASGNMAHAEGYGTHSVRRSQHVFGEFNVEDTGGSGTTGRGTYIEVVGKGTGDASRSNARTLDWSGNEVLAGGLKVNSTNDVLNVSPNLTSIAKNASSTITLNKPFGILMIARASSAQVASISYYALYLHNNAYVNYNMLTNAADPTVTLTTLGNKQLQISTTADYGIGYKLLEI